MPNPETEPLNGKSPPPLAFKTASHSQPIFYEWWGDTSCAAGTPSGPKDTPAASTSAPPSGRACGLAGAPERKRPWNRRAGNGGHRATTPTFGLLRHRWDRAEALRAHAVAPRPGGGPTTLIPERREAPLLPAVVLVVPSVALRSSLATLSDAFRRIFGRLGRKKGPKAGPVKDQKHRFDA